MNNKHILLFVAFLAVIVAALAVPASEPLVKGGPINAGDVAWIAERFQMCENFACAFV